MLLIQILVTLIPEYYLTLKKHLDAFAKPNPPLSWQHGDKGDVVIIHGFGEVWTFFETIGDHLNHHGYRVHFISALKKNHLPLKDAVEIVEDYIIKNNLNDIILLSHSKGGIIAKCVLDTYPDRIQKSITLAVPYGGTVFAHLRIHNLDEGIPGSLWMRRVHKHTSHNKKIYNLYPRFDNHVIPHKYLLLPGAHNIKIPVIGHARIMQAKETLNEIDRIIPS